MEKDAEELILRLQGSGIRSLVGRRDKIWKLFGEGFVVAYRRKKHLIVDCFLLQIP